MGKYIFSVVLMLLHTWGVTASAQTLQPTVIASGGSSFSNSAFQLSYTLGEAAVTTLVSGTTMLTQGFHQTYLTSVGNGSVAYQPDVRLYPNPASSHVKMEISGINGWVNISLYSLLGERVYCERRHAAEEISIDVSGLASGAYLMRLSDEVGNGIGVFRIGKIH